MPTTPKIVTKNSFALNQLDPNPENPRTITDDRKEKLKTQLAAFGQVEPLLARKMAKGRARIISGHQRAVVMGELGWTTARVSLIECDDVTERRLLLELNGHAGQWDDDALRDVLEDLKAEGIDLKDLQIDAQALDDELAKMQAELDRELNQGGNQGTQEEKPLSGTKRRRGPRVCPHCGEPLDEGGDSDE
jgi:ParB-like chromosome segregation protein Spo0J